MKKHSYFCLTSLGKCANIRREYEISFILRQRETYYLLLTRAEGERACR